ncbi:ATP-dependent DNA helicase PIF1 [Linum perenne]
MDAIETKKGKLFFLHGHGGTGKTFLYNCIISKVRSIGDISLVVASSGIAATLLQDGVTSHSRFKIPLEIDSLSTCTVKKGSDVAELLKIATLIVWDDAPGENYVPFGGKVVLLGGDFRQTLPVVPNGSREDNINATLPRSYLWTYCTLLHLKINMRITTNSINTTPMFDGLTFPDWVLAVGNGTLRTRPTKTHTMHNDLITIPSPFLIQTTTKPLDELITRVYPFFQKSYQSLQYIKSRAIVSPTNAVVSEINNILLAQISGPSKIYFSSDSLSPTKIVMLLRNINPTSGMCNGTHVLLTDLGEYVISGLIVSGTLERRQFPIRICYAMTINKSQGQTLDHVGIYLPKPVFSHYVAVSRVRSATGLHILISNMSPNPDNETRNIVYQDILHEIM